VKLTPHEEALIQRCENKQLEYENLETPACISDYGSMVRDENDRMARVFHVDLLRIIRRLPERSASGTPYHSLGPNPTPCVSTERYRPPSHTIRALNPPVYTERVGTTREPGCVSHVSHFPHVPCTFLLVFTTKTLRNARGEVAEWSKALPC
jgi:hypothetical protein